MMEFIRERCIFKSFILSYVVWYRHERNYAKGLKFRAGSRTATTSKMEHFVIIVNGFQSLTIITKRSIILGYCSCPRSASELFLFSLDIRFWMFLLVNWLWRIFCQCSHLCTFHFVEIFHLVEIFAINEWKLKRSILNRLKYKKIKLWSNSLLEHFSYVTFLRTILINASKILLTRHELLVEF